jgi:type IV pilus assembly protein PilB
MRRICAHCKEPLSYPDTMFRDLGIPANFFESAVLHRGRGCERCNNTGYSGRSAIVEAMTITDEIRKVIIARGSSMEIGKIAVSQGMKTLRYVALDKVREGMTTLEQTLVITAAH